MEDVVKAAVPLGRMGEKADIALACVYLASSAARCGTANSGSNQQSTRLPPLAALAVILGYATAWLKIVATVT